MLEVTLGGKAIPPGPKGDTRILMHMDGSNRDEKGNAVSGIGVFDTTFKKFGQSSAKFSTGGTMTVLQPDDRFTNFTEATLECWLYKVDVASWGALIAQGTSASDYIGIDCSQGYGADLLAMWPIPGGSLGRGALVPRGGFPSNKWTHFAMTWKNNVAKSYVGGKLINSFAMPYWIFRPNVGVTLGAIPYAGGYSYPGYVDEFRLSATCLYDGEFTPYEFPFTL